MVSVSGVRGIVGPAFNPLVVARWAAAFSGLLAPGPVVLGRDSRVTGEVLAQAAGALFRGLGREVWDIGIVPTPTVQLAVEHWGASGGLILSASHNPAPWNACKFVDADGSFLSPARFESLLDKLRSGQAEFTGAREYGAARDRHDEAVDLHLDAVLRAVDAPAIRAKGMRVVLDTGHGAGGVVLPELARRLGVVLEGLNLEPNGQFAANPEPTSDALKELVKSAASETSFVAMVDPDADRLALALPGTEYIGEEWTLPLVIFSLLSQKPGPVVTNLSTSSRVEAAARAFGVSVIRTPVGEAHVVGAMKREGARIGGEGNGGVIDPAVHFGRDSVVAFARLCEAEARFPGGLRGLAGQFPPRVLLKEKLPVSAERLAQLEPELVRQLGPVSDRRDGLRWTRAEGFVHIRASNTEPIVRALVEADGQIEAEGILKELRRTLGPEVEGSGVEGPGFEGPGFERTPSDRH